MNLLQHTSIWIIAPVMLAALSIAHEVGFQGGRRLVRSSGVGDSKANLVSSALTLLALLAGFTFGAALERFDIRQRLAVQEANAVGTAYLRAQVFDEPWRAALSREMLQYATVRSAFFTAVSSPPALAANDRETTAVQKRLWRTVAEAERASARPPISAPLMIAVTEMFDLAGSRRAAQDARIPTLVLQMLSVSAIVAAGVMGFAEAHGRRYSIVSTAVLSILTIAFCLILVLDRPGAGPVEVSQGSMDRTLAAIRTYEAASHSMPAAVGPP